MWSFRLDLGPVLRTLRRQPGVLFMVVLEIAAGVSTLTGLLMSSSWYGAIGDKPSRFDEANLVLVSTYTPGGSDDAIVETQRADLARARAVPGVESATAVSVSILDDRWMYPATFRDVAPDAPPPRRPPLGWRVSADDEAPRTLRLRAIAGALPAGGLPVDGPARQAVITRCVAERLRADPRDVLGRTIASEHNAPLRVAAVVEDVTMRIPFMPYAPCTVFVFGGAPVGHEARLLARAAPGARDAVLERVREAFAPTTTGRWVEVRALDSTDSIHHRIGSGLGAMLAFFGGLVGVIALLGALAATSFLVVRRTRQIGVRRALGATQADIVGYFLVENAVTMLLGTVLGLGGTALLFVMMQRFFTGISVPVGKLALGLGLFWLATLLATLLPAHRAARIPPSVASRSL
jgi:putative ABC transport system permease protein